MGSNLAKTGKGVLMMRHRREAPCADSFMIALCGDPQCRHVHVMLCDGEKRHLAQVHFNHEQLASLAEAGGYALGPLQERRPH
jgi:hypothetical protein